MDALTVHRLQFAFTITYHYLFPQLTMGLSLLLVALKTRALTARDAAERERLAGGFRFWTRIFAMSFLMGVVTGIPMEFQFGTNWAEFSRISGAVIGHTLALEAVYAFFLESTFLGLVLFGERRLGPRVHWLATFLVFLGSWVSGYFIVTTGAWMQHPVGHRVEADGRIVLESLAALLGNPWAVWQYAHAMIGSVLTAAVVMAAVGAYYLLSGQHEASARTFVRLGVAFGAVAAILQLFPTGDTLGKMVARDQPPTLAAMEGLFSTERGAPLVIVGQPDVENRRLDNPITVPRMLSFLTYLRWKAEVKGLDAFPESERPDNIPLLYYAYHIMVGLGTIFVAVLSLACWRLRRGRLFASRPLLWALLLLAPFPYIANTGGWLTAELGRQPWIVYGLLRTSAGASRNISAGNALFTLIGFMGLYALLSVLYLFLVRREIAHGPS